MNSVHETLFETFIGILSGCLLLAGWHVFFVLGFYLETK
jgi:hypothetical protein